MLYDNGTDSVIINGVTIYTNTNNYGVIGFNRLFVDQNSKASIDTNMRTDPIKDAHVASEYHCLSHTPVPTTDVQLPYVPVQRHPLPTVISM